MPDEARLAGETGPERQLPPPRGRVGRLFVRVLGTLHDWAESGWAGPAVATYNAVQGSVMPGSSDLMLVALGLADPPRAVRLALWAALGATLGGAVAYAIGAFGFDLLGAPTLALFGIERATLESYRAQFAVRGAMLVFLSSMSPLSTKLVCIAAGVFGVPFGEFLVALGLGRTLRFLAVAALLRLAGPKVLAWIEKRVGRPVAR